MDAFRDWLRENTSLSESSVRLYVRTIQRFVKQYEVLSVESINKFISESFRESYSFYVKYPFRYYLRFLKKEGLYSGVVRVKMRPRKKLGHFLPERLIKRVISAIEKDEFRDMAVLQYATGARAREVITIKGENLDFDFDDNVIRLRLEGKGGRERVTFLDRSLEPVVRKYMDDEGFLFLPRCCDDDPIGFERVVATKRTYYYNALRKAAGGLGVDRFGTHDFRRNVAELLKRKTKDVRLVQKALGHISITTTMRYFDESPDEIRQPILDHQKEDL